MDAKSIFVHYLYFLRWKFSFCKRVKLERKAVYKGSPTFSKHYIPFVLFKIDGWFNSLYIIRVTFSWKSSFHLQTVSLTSIKRELFSKILECFFDFSFDQKVKQYCFMTQNGVLLAYHLPVSNSFDGQIKLKRYTWLPYSYKFSLLQIFARMCAETPKFAKLYDTIIR